MSNYYLTYDNIIELFFDRFEIVISKKTLIRYYRFGLLSEPRRKHLGRSGGILLQFDKQVLGEIYAAWDLLKHFRFYSVLQIKLYIDNHSDINDFLMSEYRKENIRFEDNPFVRYYFNRLKINDGYLPKDKINVVDSWGRLTYKKLNGYVL